MAAVGPLGVAGGWDMLGDAQEGVGVSHRQRLPHPKEGYRVYWCGMLMLGGISWFRSSPITEVNLSLSCPERAVSNQILILQSRANLTWSLSVNNCHIQFLVGPLLRGTCVPHHPHQGGCQMPRMPVARGGWQEGTWGHGSPLAASPPNLLTLP